MRSSATKALKSIQESVGAGSIAGGQPGDEVAWGFLSFFWNNCQTWQNISPRLGPGFYSPRLVKHRKGPEGLTWTQAYVTECLWQAVSVLKVPVVAAGASGTGRQLAAALAIGARPPRKSAKRKRSAEAQGVTMATRFLCTVEAPIDMKIKEGEKLKAKPT